MARPLEERYRIVRDLFPEFRIETVRGRIVVNEPGTWQHNTILSRALFHLAPAVSGRGWEIWPNITVYLGPDDDLYVPDLAVVPSGPRLHEEHAVHGDSTILLVDVVSVATTYDVYFVKPRSYARGGVPLYLVVDPFQRRVTLFSGPGGARYRTEAAVALGEPLVLPDPWNLTVDTATLTETGP
ncbi:MAG: Uma2 family endonuclease [Nonomuraea sp.]|nr:Uma2 family endonuclease [Nonomuraea sp.]NUP67921.1 Uma2 family endonuclease [Nonomuraea sp.]NUP78140.1 Uma2 family endonuclease [Nonomuraea sp.]NUS01419.1 Uma2 family endonuclease [Nonomuraea sp.]NUT12704.1 Uma2 family endonuclease [Nonomuraea sp.]